MSSYHVVMKRKIIIAFILGFSAIVSFAQPKFASKVGKGIFSVNTYDKQGNLLHQGVGFYVGQKGEAIADYRVFKGAFRASVIEADGKKADVEYVLGADDTYSLVRFRVSTKGNVALLSATSNRPMKSGVFVLRRTDAGAMESVQAIVADTAMIKGQYVYYGLDKRVDEKWLGSPVFDESGTLVGILHSQIGDKSYVLDVRFKDELKIKAIPDQSASVALGNIFLPQALPDVQEEALIYMYLKARTASNEEYMDMVNRYIATYPQSAEGYLRRAAPLIDLTRFDEADKDLQQYLSLVEDKATGNYNVGSLIFDKLRMQPEPAYEKWNMDLVLQYVDNALSLNAAQSVSDSQKADATKFQVLKAQMLMFKRDYDSALAIYEAMNREAGGAPVYLYAISLAREGRGDSVAAVIEPLDSAIAMMGEPLPREAANHVIRRGHLKANAGKYREAVLDYNQYAYLMNNQVSAVFYYERSQVEVNGRMYEQALSDINKAIEMAPREALYQVEKAAIAIRVNMLDECIEACQAAITLNPAILDSYRILGYAQLQKGEKEKARQNLQKAVDMGDENAKQLMDTYFKNP